MVKWRCRPVEVEERFPQPAFTLLWHGVKRNAGLDFCSACGFSVVETTKKQIMRNRLFVGAFI
jgi:hypothetical protein